VTTRTASLSDDALLAPSVGTWRPHVGIGSPVAGGDLLGWLKRDGRWLEVRAPKRAAGAVHQVVATGTWVAFGASLLQLGEGLTGAVASTEAAAGDGPEGATAVRAETDGTVYLRPDPSKPNFVDEGATVAANDTLALVEVMKTFTPVKSPVAGTVIRVDVDDADAVTEGQPLFWVR
jgi:biotin carboxyl carrier protein